MRRKPGFAWALFVSTMIHIIAFLTVPMSGTVGDVRDETVRRVTETAVEFVTYVKPKPPPPPPPQPQVTQRRVVRQVVRRRPVRRAPRPRPKPVEQQAPADQPERAPEAVAEPLPPEPAPAPVMEPEPAPALAVLPPEPTPAPKPVAIASAPEPEPVIIHPTPMAAEEAAPAIEPQVASASFADDAPKAAPEIASSAPAPASATTAAPAGPSEPLPATRITSGGGRAEDAERPGPIIAMAPSTEEAPAETPGRADAPEAAAGEKLTPQMGGIPSQSPGTGGGVRGTGSTSAPSPGQTGPRFASARRAADGPAGAAAPATQQTSGTSGPSGRSPRPGPTSAGTGTGADAPKAAPTRLAGDPRPSGAGMGGDGGGGATTAAAAGSGRPVRVATHPRGSGVVHVGPPGDGGGGGASGGGAGGEAPSRGRGGEGDGWTLVKAAPREWQIVATAPGTGGAGPGGGQGGDGGMGTGEGGGGGAATGPGAGPVGPLAEGIGALSEPPAALAGMVPESLWGSMVGAIGLGALPGASPTGGLATGGEADGEGGIWAGKLAPFIARQLTGGGGPGGGAAGPGGGIAAGGDGDAPGAGGPVYSGILAGGGGPGLPPLPVMGDGAMIASAPDAMPGAAGLGLGFDFGAFKSEPGGGLYTNISGSFDMPMGVTTADYQADAPGMLNLLGEIRDRTKVRVTIYERYVPLTLENIQHTPVLHLRGHRAFSLTEEERETLRQYVAQGGTIFGEDSHGPFGECFKREMQKTFGTRLQDLGIDHEVYRAHYVLDRVPAGDMGERYPLQGIEADGDRLGVIFSRNDYGDCWEGTGEWVKPESREPAFRMGVNIFTYVVAKWQKLREQQ